jgi:hypothetical protein
MKLNNLMTFNALLFIALGIAFALYGPLMIAMFGVAQLTQGDALLYWYAVSFARMFGAGLFGFGFLIWAARNFETGEGRAGSVETRRGILFALLLANALGLFVAATQHFSVWQSAGGWFTIGVFLLLILGYGFFMIRSESS